MVTVSRSAMDVLGCEIFSRDEEHIEVWQEGASGAKVAPSAQVAKNPAGRGQHVLHEFASAKVRPTVSSASGGAGFRKPKLGTDMCTLLCRRCLVD